MSNVFAFDPDRRKNRRPPAARTTTSRPAETPPSGTSMDSLWRSWRISLEEADKSPYTIKNYGQTIEYFIGWLKEHGHPTDSESITADHCRLFLIHERTRTSAASAAGHHQHLRTFWKWVVKEGERSTESPMTNVGPIKVPDKVRSFFTSEQCRKMLNTCKGTSFRERRDRAILGIFMDTGVRISGMVGMRYTPDDPDTNDVYVEERRIRICLKGGAEHWIPLGKKTTADLDRYLRARDKHEHADSQWLWLGASGVSTDRLTLSGVFWIVRTRGEQAGVANAHPHRFRRTFAHDYLDGGGDVDGLMAIAGWKSYRMPQVYAGDLAAERARQAHRKLSPRDRL